MKRRVYSNTPHLRAAWTFAVLTLSLLPIGAPLAQDENSDTSADLESCAALEEADARLACYDRLLGRPVSPQESPAPTATQAVPVPQAAAPETATAVAPVAATAAAPAPPPAEENLRRTIVVREVRLRTPSDAVFITDSGEIWHQTGSGRGRYPEVPFEATLESGSLGSTFLVSPAGGPRIRVVLRD
jgi:hypothetical protein